MRMMMLRRTLYIAAAVALLAVTGVPAVSARPFMHPAGGQVASASASTESVESMIAAAIVGESWCEQQCNNAPNAAACMARCRRLSVASASDDNSDSSESSSSAAALVGGIKCSKCLDVYYECAARITGVTPEKMKSCREEEAKCRRTCDLNVASVPSVPALASTVGESWCEQHECIDAPNVAKCMTTCNCRQQCGVDYMDCRRNRWNLKPESWCHKDMNECDRTCLLNDLRVASSSSSSSSACERCISNCGASLSCVFVSCRPICPTEVRIGAALGQRSSSVGAIPFTCDWDYENCMSTYAQTHSEFTKKYCADAYQSCKSSVSVAAAVKPTQVGVF